MNGFYGIDFGTTNSVLARIVGGRTDVVTLDDRLPAEWMGTGFDKVLPSVIAFDDATPIFGWPAKRRQRNKLEAVKRLLATEDEVEIGDRRLRVEEVGATFFRHMQGRVVAEGLTEPLDRAVVTIPANSRGVARYRTKLAAGLAGIEVAALINEPTAAALAFARDITRHQRIMVFDWGGGTLDVTVLEAQDGTFIEQVSKGVQRLGGIDVDELLMGALLTRISGATAWGEPERNQFRLDLERAKIELSTRAEADLPLPHGGYHSLTRSFFEEAARPIFERTREPVERCLRESPGRIHHLVLVGGSSKIPAIQRFVSDLVGAPVAEGVDPMTAIAEGAAIAAGILGGVLPDLDFFVGTEHALGTIAIKDGAPQFSVLIPRNMKLPARQTEHYIPTNPDQTHVSVEVLEGDPDLPLDHEDNVLLKEWSVELFERRAIIDDSAFTVTFEYDVNGIIQVEVLDILTGTVMMNEPLSFGAAQDRSALPKMRQVVDAVMAHPSAGGGTQARGGLSADATQAIASARRKVIPFVTESDAQVLEELILDVQEAGADEAPALEALRRELRKHAYLL